MVDAFRGRFGPDLIPQDQIFRIQTRGSTPQFTLDTDDGHSIYETAQAQLGYSYMPLIDAVTNAVRFRDEEDPDYNPLTDMMGYEEYAKELIDAKNEMKNEFKELNDEVTDQLNYIEAKLGNGRGSKQRRKSGT